MPAALSRSTTSFPKRLELLLRHVLQLPKASSSGAVSTRRASSPRPKRSDPSAPPTPAVAADCAERILSTALVVSVLPAPLSPETRMACDL